MSRVLMALLGALAMAAAAAATPEKAVEDYRDVRGAIVYRTYCVLCHGALADGRGRAARNYDPPPADLTRSTASAAYREAIIRRGGEAMGRSRFMPPWGQELTNEQIQDVVHFLTLVRQERR